MKITKRQLRRIIRESCRETILRNSIRRRLVESILPELPMSSVNLAAVSVIDADAANKNSWGEDYIEDFMSQSVLDVLSASSNIEEAVRLASDYIGNITDEILKAVRVHPDYLPESDSRIMDLVSGLGTKLIGYFENAVKDTELWGKV